MNSRPRAQRFLSSFLSFFLPSFLSFFLSSFLSTSPKATPCPDPVSYTPAATLFFPWASLHVGGAPFAPQHPVGTPAPQCLAWPPHPHLSNGHTCEPVSLLVPGNLARVGQGTYAPWRCPPDNTILLLPPPLPPKARRQQQACSGACPLCAEIHTPCTPARIIHPRSAPI